MELKFLTFFISLSIVIASASVQSSENSPAYFTIVYHPDVQNHIEQIDSKSTYRAGVVEYHPDTTAAFEEINLESYLKFIDEASEQNVDILVFPESSLNRDWSNSLRTINAAFPVPHGNEKSNPCTDESPHSKILTSLSCAARQKKIYIVVNVVEIDNCNDIENTRCIESNTLLFNTNVVFDRNGTIISRYRKINLYGEKGFTPSLDNELGVFETDFDVKFGHFICFDLIFQQPAVQVIEKENVQNIVFPAMWFSQLPFLTAVQIQESFAFSHNINLLAAGANNPFKGSTGSGIYSGKNGALVSTMNGEVTSELLVAELPKNPSQSILKKETPTKPVNKPSVMDGLFLKTDRLGEYNSQLIDESINQQFINISHGNVECYFDIAINKNFTPLYKSGTEHYRYRAIVFDGIKTTSYKTRGMSNCAIVACTNEELETCAKRFPSYSSLKPVFEFTRIELTAIVLKPEYNSSMESTNIVYHPVTLSTSITPIPLQNIKYTIEDLPQNIDKQQVSMILEEPTSELLSFGVYGRIYERDEFVTANDLYKLYKADFIKFLLKIKI